MEDVVGVAAAREIVGGPGEALQDRADGSGTADALGDQSRARAQFQNRMPAFGNRSDTGIVAEPRPCIGRTLTKASYVVIFMAGFLSDFNGLEDFVAQVVPAAHAPLAEAAERRQQAVARQRRGEDGKVEAGALAGDLTPSHHSPTGATVPIDRRTRLLQAAAEKDFVIVEDDYEFEISYLAPPSPALKAFDSTGRVLYIGSFSKSLFPGRRLGYLVAPAPPSSARRAPISWRSAITTPCCTACANIVEGVYASGRASIASWRLEVGANPQSSTSRSRLWPQNMRGVSSAYPRSSRSIMRSASRCAASSTAS